MERSPNPSVESDIYKDIENEDFKTAISKLTKKKCAGENPRAVHSLLGYCYFQIGNYKESIEMYEYLSNKYPDYQEYKLYNALCLYKTAKLEAAARMLEGIDDPSLSEKVEQLKAAISFSKNNFSEARDHLVKGGKKDAYSTINEGCILFKEHKYAEALKKLQEGIALVGGYHSQLYYNIALCYYKTGKHAESLKFIKTILDKTNKILQEQHPGVPNPENNKANERLAHEVRQSGIIEALNLKAAIEYERGKVDKSKRVLKDLNDLLTSVGLQKDPTTYHNEAIVGVNDNCAESIRKLDELLHSPSCPPETFQNLIHLYCKYRFFDLARELLKTEPQLASKYIQRDEYEYIKALIQEEKQPEEAIKQYDTIIASYKKNLDTIAKKLEQGGGDTEKHSSLAEEKKYIIDRLVCVLSNKARIFWEAKDFVKTEQVFDEVKDYCKGSEIFNMNMGHSLFMQEERYDEVIEYYEEIVKKHKDNLNEVDIFVLANLCLCYILTKQEEKAQQLMNNIKSHEDEAIMKNPGSVLLHYCSVNLVIGTLYCSKMNFEFGLDLIIKHLYPIEEKLGTDTWHYVKRCLLSFIEQLTKKQINLKDPLFITKIISFLEDVQTHGKNITTVFDNKSTYE
jgi:tetratricopeptide repeat protein 30